MRNKLLTAAFCALLGFGLSQGAVAAGVAPPVAAGPLNLNALPGQPTWPTSGSALTCQSYALNGWYYKVLYVRNPKAETWRPLAYEAYRLNLSDGTTVRSIRDLTRPSSQTKGPNACPTGNDNSLLTGPIVVPQRCEGCDPPPPPPSWSEVAAIYPRPSHKPVGATNPPKKHFAAFISHSGIAGYWNTAIQYGWGVTPDRPKGAWYLVGLAVWSAHKGSGASAAD